VEAKAIHPAVLFQHMSTVSVFASATMSMMLAEAPAVVFLQQLFSSPEIDETSPQKENLSNLVLLLLLNSSAYSVYNIASYFVLR